MTDWKRYPDEKPIEWEKVLYVSPTSGSVVLACTRYFDTQIGTKVLKLGGLHVQPDDEVYWTPIPEVPAEILPEVQKAEREVRRLREKLREAESLIAEMTAGKEQRKLV